MIETVVTWLLLALVLYLAMGVLFAVPFCARGVRSVDPDARRGSIAFRLLIFPGTVALWPMLAMRFSDGVGGLPAERTPHRTAARRRTR